MRISRLLVPDPPHWFSGNLYHKFFTQAYQGVQIAQSLRLAKWFIVAASDVLRDNELAETTAADSIIYIRHVASGKSSQFRLLKRTSE